MVFIAIKMIESIVTNILEYIDKFKFILVLEGF